MVANLHALALLILFIVMEQITARIEKEIKYEYGMNGGLGHFIGTVVLNAKNIAKSSVKM
jgi:hypothetical protein